MRTVRVACCSPATLAVLALSIVVTAHRVPAWQSRSGLLRTVTSTRVGVLCGCSSVRRTLSVTQIRDPSPTTTGPSCDGGVPYTGGGRAAVNVVVQAGREPHFAREGHGALCPTPTVQGPAHNRP